MSPLRLSELNQRGIELAALEIGLSEAQYVELLEIYLERMRDGIAELKSAFDSGDDDLAKRTIHTIKGTSQNMRLEIVAAPAAVVDDLLRSGRRAEALSSLADLENAFENLLIQARQVGIVTSG